MTAEANSTFELASLRIPSIKHMNHIDKLHCTQQMIQDLGRLAKDDGCIGAAWALEALEALAAMQPHWRALAEAAEAGIETLKRAPELNARNFDEDDALKLNDAVNDVVCLIENALAAAQSKGGQ